MEKGDRLLEVIISPALYRVAGQNAKGEYHASCQSAVDSSRATRHQAKDVMAAKRRKEAQKKEHPEPLITPMTRI
jgi:hypothetical protein